MIAYAPPMRAMSGASKRPETQAQADEWDRAKRRYVDEGVCHACACQAAWGHQLGFSNVRPPCESCWAVVDRQSTPMAVSGWRPIGRRRTRGRPVQAQQPGWQ